MNRPYFRYKVWDLEREFERNMTNTAVVSTVRAELQYRRFPRARRLRARIDDYLMNVAVVRQPAAARWTWLQEKKQQEQENRQKRDAERAVERKRQRESAWNEADDTWIRTVQNPDAWKRAVAGAVEEAEHAEQQPNAESKRRRCLLDFLKRDGTAIPDTPEEKRILTALAAAGHAR